VVAFDKFEFKSGGFMLLTPMTTDMVLPVLLSPGFILEPLINLKLLQKIVRIYSKWTAFAVYILYIIHPHHIDEK
jgi:hypothetical protein